MIFCYRAGDEGGELGCEEKRKRGRASGYGCLFSKQEWLSGFQRMFAAVEVCDNLCWVIFNVTQHLSSALVCIRTNIREMGTTK